MNVRSKEIALFMERPGISLNVYVSQTSPAVFAVDVGYLMHDCTFNIPRTNVGASEFCLALCTVV